MSPFLSWCKWCKARTEMTPSPQSKSARKRFAPRICKKCGRGKR